ncbi:hypothetical protein HGRIS_001576 [Hohenbuehelia grisea]|uniref:Uncharacterized protein n=1 Tax=Hohenbuehelia grisea TaxID=104357 RepID=A0ABR3JPR0_9AGAR
MNHAYASTASPNSKKKSKRKAPAVILSDSNQSDSLQRPTIRLKRVSHAPAHSDDQGSKMNEDTPADFLSQGSDAEMHTVSRSRNSQSRDKRQNSQDAHSLSSEAPTEDEAVDYNVQEDEDLQEISDTNELRNIFELELPQFNSPASRSGPLALRPVIHMHHEAASSQTFNRPGTFESAGSDLNGVDVNTERDAPTVSNSGWPTEAHFTRRHLPFSLCSAPRSAKSIHMVCLRMRAEHGWRIQALSHTILRGVGKVSDSEKLADRFTRDTQFGIIIARPVSVWLTNLCGEFKKEAKAVVSGYYNILAGENVEATVKALLKDSKYIFQMDPNA